VRWLRAHAAEYRLDPGRFAVGGTSAGGHLAAMVGTTGHVRELVGGAIQENPKKVARANPITYVTAEAPPFLVVHGDRDPIVPHHQSEILVDALREAGVPVIFYTVVGGGHGQFDDPKAPELTKEFLARHLRPPR